jgi:hypothetical protein
VGSKLDFLERKIPKHNFTGIDFKIWISSVSSLSSLKKPHQERGLLTKVLHRFSLISETLVPRTVTPISDRQ